MSVSYQMLHGIIFMMDLVLAVSRQSFDHSYARKLRLFCLRVFMHAISGGTYLALLCASLIIFT